MPEIAPIAIPASRLPSNAGNELKGREAKRLVETDGILKRWQRAETHEDAYIVEEAQRRDG